MKNILLLLLLQSLCLCSYGLNITIIESKSHNGSDDMDMKWSDIVTCMGHTPTIAQQITLDNNTFFSSTDILIISSAVINILANRVNTILEFLQSGKPVYLQSEYLSAYPGNKAFLSIVTSLGGTFAWNKVFNGIIKMNVISTFSTTSNTVSALDCWYSLSGSGNCNTVNFIEFGVGYHGFKYIPTNNSYGSIITTSDQDWVCGILVPPNPQLMENIITNLISPCSN